VRLVDSQSLRLLWPLRLELVGLFRVPEDSVEEVAFVVLPGKFGPGGDAIGPLPILLSDASLKAALVLDGKSSICIFGQDQAPNTKGIFFARVGVPVPLIEITELTGMRTRCLQWRLPWHLGPILYIQGRHLCLH
jgi:hypothetical protein